MLRPHGYFICVDPDPARGQPGTIERDFFTCGHCSSWNRVKPNQDAADAGAICQQCGELICKTCKQRGGCMPIEMACEIIEGPIRKLEATIKQNEDRGRFLREVFGA